jgi:flagellar hook-basal body complex protein FliE
MKSAVAAYNNALKGGGEAMEARDKPAESAFAGLVKGAIGDALDIGKASENLSVAAINNKADLSQVVTAVSEADVALQTVVAVRDRVLEAYQSIIRMPI